MRGSFQPQSLEAKFRATTSLAFWRRSANSAAVSQPGGKCGGSCQLPPSRPRISSLRSRIGSYSQNPLGLSGRGPSRYSAAPR